MRGAVRESESWRGSFDDCLNANMPRTYIRRRSSPRMFYSVLHAALMNLVAKAVFQRHS
jgi:hypothetical protein